MPASLPPWAVLGAVGGAVLRLLGLEAPPAMEAPLIQGLLAGVPALAEEHEKEEAAVCKNLLNVIAFQA